MKTHMVQQPSSGKTTVWAYRTYSDKTGHARNITEKGQ